MRRGGKKLLSGCCPWRDAAGEKLLSGCCPWRDAAGGKNCYPVVVLSEMRQGKKIVIRLLPLARCGKGEKTPCYPVVVLGRGKLLSGCCLWRDAARGKNTLLTGCCPWQGKTVTRLLSFARCGKGEKTPCYPVFIALCNAELEKH